eukprot:scaffold26350_cov42-Cyclotella_meneghiniana.AAC.1
MFGHALGGQNVDMIVGYCFKISSCELNIYAKLEFLAKIRFPGSPQITVWIYMKQMTSKIQRAGYVIDSHTRELVETNTGFVPVRNGSSADVIEQQIPRMDVFIQI